jgi:hypothetical protein
MTTDHIRDMDLSEFNTQFTLTYDSINAHTDLAAAHDFALSGLHFTTPLRGELRYILVTERHGESGNIHHHGIANTPPIGWTQGGAKIAAAPSGGFVAATVADYFGKEPDALIHIQEPPPELVYVPRCIDPTMQIGATVEERQEQFMRRECHYWDVYPEVGVMLIKLGTLDAEGSLLPEGMRR